VTVNRNEHLYLRQAVFDLLPELVSKVHDLTYKAIETKANQKIGPRSRRIGVFGSYENKHILNEIAKHISTLNYVSVTGMGYYLPRKANRFHRIDEVFPPAADLLLKSLPLYYYRKILTRIVSKAIFFLNMPYGQLEELSASAEYEMPVMGLIMHGQITKSEQDCPYLHVEGSTAKCVVPHDSLCPASFPVRPFCPFVDSIPLPYMTLKILHETNNHLVAAKDRQGVRLVINSFLRSGKRRRQR